MDDFVIFSNHSSQHVKNIDEVLTQLRLAGVTLNQLMVTFSKNVKYFGHIHKPG